MTPATGDRVNKKNTLRGTFMDFGIFNLMNRRHRSQTVPQVIAETVEQIQLTSGNELVIL